MDPVSSMPVSWKRSSRPREIPANALFIPKPYVGRAVIDAVRTFENM
jgi:hypothetical protein